MLVVNTEPFDLVYTLVNHSRLGFVLEPHVVQINATGKYTLTHQRIFSKTADYFSKKISNSDKAVIKILDELDDDFLFRRFYQDGKKKIRTAEFFEKYCPPELFQEQIRPFIEARMHKALKMLKGKVIYKMGNDNNPTSQTIHVSNERASTLFHFKRDNEGTRYFPTIKFKGQRIEFMFKGALIINNYPAWMLLEDNLFDFEKDIDGKKLMPFLNKRFIEIPKSGEENYFNKFVAHLVERYDVHAEGFKIITEKAEGGAVLKVQPFLDEESISMKLVFQYDKAAFEYGTEQQLSAIVEHTGNDYTFRRIRRNRTFEEETKKAIEDLGLKQLNGAYFTLKDIQQTVITDQLIPLETTNKYEFLEWFNEHLQALKKLNITVEQSAEFNKYFIGHREIKLEVKEHNDWFDVKAVVKFGEYTFPFISLKENILKGKREFILPNGLVAVIPEEWFGNLAGILEFSASEDEIKLGKHHVGLIEEIASQGGKHLRLNDKLQKIKSYGQVREMDMPKSFQGELRPYQKAGFNWFYFLKENNFGGCLADDMGLGKTIQTLALLQKEKELYALTYLNSNPARVIMRQGTEEVDEKQFTLFKSGDTNEIKNPVSLTHPLDNKAQPPSTIENSIAIPEEAAENEMIPHEVEDDPSSQQRGSETIADSLRTFIRTSLIIVPNSLVYNWFHEANKFTPEIKILIYTGINREKNPHLFQNYDLVVTTYGTVRVDIDILKEYKFNYVILDESQSVKNPNALSSRAVKLLKAANRLVLTGTPIENSVQELWSQLSFINPGLVGGLQSFIERFVIPIEKGKDVHKLQQLKSIIKPFILRRTKDQVAKELPPKIEQVKYCNMTEEQAEAYEKVKSYFRNEILKSIQDVGINKSHIALLQGLTKLRQIANHPRLTNPDYTGQAGKFDEIVAMAETAKEEGHKVLIFSQFVKQLDIYRKYFDEKSWAYCYLDGSMSNEQRQLSVEKFQGNENIPYFLISLKAGGVGLNLTSADYVFIIDPWWNPAVEQQAIDRTHRIGQNKTVFTYKFITKDTVEEKILALQQKKKELAGSIITTEDGFIKNINVDEILELFS